MPFLELTRPANSLMAAIAAWLGYSLALNAPAFDATIALIATATFLVSAGGQAVNDYFDRDVDALRKR
ncbi:digeranylgeranylglyceryl phosphate synthase, partial [Candidatus Micrarchaeota archaeon CG_4_10_14_0_8_um_filter_60_7]